MSGLLERSTLSDPNVNQIRGMVSGRLLASKTYPSGINILPEQFLEREEDEEEWPLTAALLTTIDTIVFDTSDITALDPDNARRSKGILVSLNLLPTGYMAALLRELIPAEHRLGGRPPVTIIEESDRIALALRYPDGSEADLSGGALICRCISERNAQFTFSFADAIID